MREEIFRTLTCGLPILYVRDLAFWEEQSDA